MKKNKTGVILTVAVLFLTVFGLIMVYSASKYTAQNSYNDAFFFLKKQAIGVVIGLTALIFFTYYDYHKLTRFSLPLVLLSYALLILVFVPGISKESYGAKRWIRVFGFTLQPSEIAKFAWVVFFAGYVTKMPERIRSFKGILFPLFVGAVSLVLIILEPNMSVTVCFAGLIFVMLFLAGTKVRNLAWLCLPAVGAIPLLIIAEPYRLKRLSAFLDPWASPKGEGYQLLQSLYAIGNGGWWGVGLFHSRQKYQFLPFAESDFILSVIAEEWGFVGCLALFGIFAVVIGCGYKIAKHSKDILGYLLATGFTTVFALQCIINALVVSGTIPPTGLPLPLISSGNTSIIVFMAEFGILLNVASQGEDV